MSFRKAEERCESKGRGISHRSFLHPVRFNVSMLMLYKQYTSKYNIGLSTGSQMYIRYDYAVGIRVYYG